MNFVIPSVLVIVLVVAIALWARGLIKSSRGDMIAGCCVFVAMSLLGILTVGSSGIVPFLGIALIALSIDTLVAGAFAGTTCPLKRGSRFTLSIGLILLGIVFLLVV